MKKKREQESETEESATEEEDEEEEDRSQRKTRKSKTKKPANKQKVARKKEGEQCYDPYDFEDDEDETQEGTKVVCVFDTVLFQEAPTGSVLVRVFSWERDFELHCWQCHKLI